MLRLFAAMFLVTIATAPAAAYVKDYPHSGYCKNGKQVMNVAHCPENRNKDKSKKK
jgi:hypothetical protein